MHLGRFHYVAWELRNYYKKNDLLTKLDTAISLLQAYASAPTSENAVAFRNSITKLFESVSALPEDAMSSSFQQIVFELSANNLFGSEIRKLLEQILSSQSLPSEMLSEMQKFRKEFASFISSITQLADGLDELGVEYEHLSGGEYEFGILLPRDVVGETVADIQKELEHINTLLMSLNELMGKGRTSPTVRTISASWWQFFLNLDHVQISAIVLALERIVNLYKTSLEIKKLRKEAEKQELGAEVAEMIDRKIEEKLKSGIQAISTDIRAKFAQLEDLGRCNELEIEIRHELLHLAKRINQGAAYEVRAGIPDAPKDLKEADAQIPELVQQHQEKIEAYKALKAAAESINQSAGVINEEIFSLSEPVMLTDYEKLTFNDDAKK